VSHSNYGIVVICSSSKARSLQAVCTLGCGARMLAASLGHDNKVIWEASQHRRQHAGMVGGCWRPAARQIMQDVLNKSSLAGSFAPLGLGAGWSKQSPGACPQGANAPAVPTNTCCWPGWLPTAGVWHVSTAGAPGVADMAHACYHQPGATTATVRRMCLRTHA
jgi:hypothetical protein